MDHKACGGLVVAPGAVPQSQEPDIAGVALSCLGAAALALVTYSFAVSMWWARHEPGALAFVAGAYAALATLLLCLRRAQRLAPDAHARERRRLHVAVWALSTAVGCAFAYRVSLIMPAELAVAIWCMTAFVVLVGFYYLLVLCNCKDQQGQGLEDDVGCDGVVSKREPFIKETRATDEMV